MLYWPRIYVQSIGEARLLYKTLYKSVYQHLNQQIHAHALYTCTLNICMQTKGWRLRQLQRTCLISCSTC